MGGDERGGGVDERGGITGVGTDTAEQVEAWVSDWADADRCVVVHTSVDGAPTELGCCAV